MTEALTRDDEYAGKALLRLAAHWGMDPERALSRAIDDSLAAEGFAELRQDDDDARAFATMLRQRLDSYGGDPRVWVSVDRPPDEVE